MEATLTAGPVREITVESRRGPRTVHTLYTNLEAIERLQNVPGDFAADLARQWQNRQWLSPTQIKWVHVLVCDHDEEMRRRAGEDAIADIDAVVSDDGQMEGVIALFAKASQHLKFPKIRLHGKQADYLLSLAGERSRNPGSVNVKTESGIYLGRISTDGLWFGKADARAYPEIVGLLADLARDPAGVAARYGHETDRCCFCGLGLTDPRSTKVGYGPVCAKNYGLAWGEK